MTSSPGKLVVKLIDTPCVEGGKALALCDESGRIIGRQIGCSVSCEVGGLPIATVKLAIDGDRVSFGDAG